jgi:hypothetical protein
VDTQSQHRAVLFGHLFVTLPAIAAILMVAFLGFFFFGPDLLTLYVLAGVTVGFAWCTLFVPRWKRWLIEGGAEENEVEHLLRSTNFAWPTGPVGLIAFHTTLAMMCAVHFGPWLVGRWFAWVVPLTGVSTTTFAGDYYLQHLELVSIIPAAIVGYLVSQRLQPLATRAWVLPTLFLLYKILTFRSASASVLFPTSPSSVLSYFFVVQRSMPSLSDLHDFRGVDPVRVAQQMTVVAPFYSGLAYSIGALAAKHDLLGKIVGTSTAGCPTQSRFSK